MNEIKRVRMVMFKLVSIFSMVLWVSGVNAQQIIAIDIPGLHNNDGKGMYDLIIKKAAGENLLMMPPSRAISAYESCTDCCLSPANKNPDFYDYGEGHIVSKPMFTAKVYIFSKPDEAAISDISMLTGKKVGARKGMPYGNNIESSGARLLRVDKLSQNIKKLERGRLDYIVAYTPDIYDVFDSMEKTPFPHVKERPVATHEDSLLCKDTPANRQLIERLNGEI